MIAPARGVFASIARADENAGIRPRRRLADLHIDVAMMQDDLAGNSDAAELRSNFEFAGRESQRVGELLETRSRFSMEPASSVRLVRAVGIPVHHKTSRAGGVVVSTAD